MDTASKIATQFNDVLGFIRELEADRDQVERAIVRVTLSTVRQPSLATEELWLEAGAIVAGRLVQYRHLCGDLTGIPCYDDPVRAVAEQLEDSLIDAVGRLDLEARAGRWVTP